MQTLVQGGEADDRLGGIRRSAASDSPMMGKAMGNPALMYDGHARLAPPPAALSILACAYILCPGCEGMARPINLLLLLCCAAVPLAVRSADTVSLDLRRQPSSPCYLAATA